MYSELHLETIGKPSSGCNTNKSPCDILQLFSRGKVVVETLKGLYAAQQWNHERASLLYYIYNQRVVSYDYPRFPVRAVILSRWVIKRKKKMAAVSLLDDITSHLSLIHI